MRGTSIAFRSAILLLVCGTAAEAQLRPLITPQDYPESVFERNEQGTVFFHLIVGTDGRVKDCQITRSSGYRDLDDTTCRILSKRARFEPKLGSDGKPVEFAYDDKVALYFAH